MILSSVAACKSTTVVAQLVLLQAECRGTGFRIGICIASLGKFSWMGEAGIEGIVPALGLIRCAWPAVVVMGPQLGGKHPAIQVFS